MQQVNKSLFHTIDADEIEFFAYENDKSTEIILKRNAYDAEQRYKTKKISIEFLCCILIYTFISLHTIFTVIGVVLLILCFFDVYSLINLVEYGKLC